MLESGAKLGEPLEIVLGFKAEDVSGIWVEMSDDHGRLSRNSGGREIGSGEAKVVGESTNSTTIEIVPLQIGQITVEIIVAFADGSIAHQSLFLKVMPPTENIKKFSLYHGNPAVSIILGSDDGDGEVRLSPEVLLEGIDDSVYLSDSTGVQFQVQQPDNPIIRVQSDGLISGLRPGRVTLIGRYGGLEDRIIVDVHRQGRLSVGHKDSSGQ